MKRIAAAACLSLLLSLTACSDGQGSDPVGSSSVDASSAESAAADPADTSSLTDSSVPETGSQGHFAPSEAVGERLKAVYDIYSKGTYTLECTLTGTDIDGEIKLLQIADGGDLYQLQTEALGSHGTVTLSGKSYDFDYVCGMYRGTVGAPKLNVVTQIVENGVPRTNTAVHEDEGYDTEQYTYTGDTYITVMDFFFDKQDGHLVKYDTTYKVEGRDDVVETRTVTRLDNEADGSVFNAYFADTLVDFDSMSEEQRLGFCQGLCASYGITPDEMSDFGVTAAELGKVDYDTLSALIHTCGKPRDRQGAAESSAESAADAANTDTSTDDASKDDTANADVDSDGSSDDSTDSEARAETEPSSAGADS